MTSALGRVVVTSALGRVVVKPALLGVVVKPEIGDVVVKPAQRGVHGNHNSTYVHCEQKMYCALNNMWLLVRMLGMLQRERKYVYICGDFNVNTLHKDNRGLAKQDFINLLSSELLKILQL